MFYLFYAFVWLIAWMPLRALYLLSDIMYLIVYYLVGYRKKVVRMNLSNSFPQHSAASLGKIERAFYRHFCDVFVETLYEMHCSEKEIKKRMVFINIDKALAEYDKGRSSLLMTAHYGNWEWTSSFSLWLPSDKPLYGVYKKLSSKNFNQFMCDLRMKFTGLNVEKDDLLRKLIELKRDGKLAMFGMISDQTPPRISIHYWTTFLNQDTAILTGTETLAKKLNLPVFYGKITRVKRGYYTCEFIPIAIEPKETAEFEITDKYIRLLEEQILSAPEYWLWTHKRWKHKRQK